jgi:ADP-L-glycero-D-manno-heptose 6-epimerase
MSYAHKIVVTGGAGFIGSALVWRLNQLGESDILIVDRLDTSDKWKNLNALKFADYVDADDFLRDLEKLYKTKTGDHRTRRRFYDAE